MDKKFIVAILVIVGLFGGYLYSQKKDTATDTTSQASASDHVRGSRTASVQIVEYGDFQCPACGGFFPILQQVEAKYGDKIGVSFKHFPLDSIHPNARAAHRAAQAAALQDKFFEMHDLLYQNQNAWKESTTIRADLQGYAKQLSLDMTKFDSDYASESTNATINADIKDGQNKKVNSTPTFFINGQQIDNNKLASLELFSAEIDRILGSTPVTDPETTQQTTNQ